MLTFRPHHFMCTLGFQGMGYSPAFVTNYKDIAATLKANPRTDIKVSFSLDSILPNLKDVSLLRINNYGAEFEVLLGAVNIIKNSPQISIIIELNKNYLVNPQVATSVIKDLYDMGFEFWHLEIDGKKTLLTQDRLLSLQHADLLITKKGIY